MYHYSTVKRCGEWFISPPVPFGRSRPITTILHRAPDAWMVVFKYSKNMCCELIRFSLINVRENKRCEGADTYRTHDGQCFRQ